MMARIFFFLHRILGDLEDRNTNRLGVVVWPTYIRVNKKRTVISYLLGRCVQDPHALLPYLVHTWYSIISIVFYCNTLALLFGIAAPFFDLVID
jgi:hypothetical protein